MGCGLIRHDITTKGDGADSAAEGIDSTAVVAAGAVVAVAAVAVSVAQLVPVELASHRVSG